MTENLCYIRPAQETLDNLEQFVKDASKAVCKKNYTSQEIENILTEQIKKAIETLVLDICDTNGNVLETMLFHEDDFLYLSKTDV